MTRSSSQAKQSLTLTGPISNLILARRLSPAVAFRYQAVPVAAEGDRITVAMVNPDDPAAVEAIRADLGTKPYVVRCEAEAIEATLAQVWPAEVYRPLRLLVCVQPGPVSAKLQAYAQRLSNQLNGHLVYLPTETSLRVTINSLAEEAGEGYDLVMLGEAEQFLWEPVLFGPLAQRMIDQVPTSLLFARRPRWPIRQILLVIRGTEREEVLLDWIVRLAQPVEATVTVLALTPSGPSYNGRTGLAALLAADSPSGRQVRRITHRLTQGQIKGLLRLRQGAPEAQLRQELDAEPYDLIILAVEPEEGRLRRLLGELVGPLLRWTDRPVLIVKTTPA